MRVRSAVVDNPRNAWRARSACWRVSVMTAQKGDVVAGDEGVVVFVGGKTGNFVGMLSDQFGCIHAGIVHDTACDLLTRGSDNRYHITVSELILNTSDAGI